MRFDRRQRRGALVVESAIVLPVMIVTLLAILAGAIAVSTYQEVASVAREAGRYASVRGHSYSISTGKPAATEQSIYNEIIQPKLVNIDPTNLEYSVTWNPDNRMGSFVTVTITYTMTIPIYGTMTFTSTSSSQITW